MAQTIWKYPLEVTDEQIVQLPYGAKILHVTEQHGTVCLWAQVNPNAIKLSDRTIHIFGTGHPMPDDPGTHIGTFLLRGGSFVFHAYEG